MNKEEKGRYLRGTIIHGFLFLGCVISLVATGYSTYRYKMYGKSAMARVIDKSRLKSDDYSYRVVFDVDGREFDRLVISSKDYRIDDIAKVYYIPNELESITLDDMKMNPNMIFLILCALFLGILFILALMFPEWMVKYYTPDNW